MGLTFPNGLAVQLGGNSKSIISDLKSVSVESYQA